MISSFKYLSPIQEAYFKVVEAEEYDENQSSSSSSSSRMSDEERRLFYQDEIKRLEKIRRYYEQQRRYGTRNVTPQGSANYALKNTIEKYRRELDRLNHKQEQTHIQVQNPDSSQKTVNPVVANITPSPSVTPSS